MTILVLTYEYPPVGSGAGIVCEQLAREWTALGHAVIVVSSGLPGRTGEQTEEGIRVVRLDTGRRSAYRANPLQMLRWMLRCRKFLQGTRLKADICLANFILPGGPAGIFAQKRLGIPFVLLSHGHDVPGAAPKDMGFYHTLFTPWIARICRKADHLVLLQENLRTLLLAFKPELRDKSSVIPNGISVKAGHSGSRKNEMPLILWAGRLVRQKRPDRFLATLAKLHVPFKAKLYGDGPWRSQVESIWREHPHRKQIQIMGHVPRKDWLKDLDKADLLVVTSEFEAMSLVQLEALERGVSQLSTAVDGMGWKVEGVPATVLDPFEPVQWARWIEQFWNDRSNLETTGSTAHVHQTGLAMTWREVARRYITLFEGLLLERSSRA